ncbi:MAG: rhodanese-like domain-containing protein, partial [Peptostreptococcaceae bacterium]|nr:rhodanese-like domain-containing protein [Peptostreptococcaceae bacterium]
MKKTLIVLAISLVLFNTGCSNNNGQGHAEDPATVNKITAEEANTRLSEESGIILVDVRTEEEYVEKHIPNAILLPVETIEENAKTVIPDKDAVYFVYCRSGNRSA